MSSTTTTTPPSPATATATATALVALTTPFVQFPGCESHWTLSNVPVVTNELRGNAISAITSIYSVLVSQHVASCHPSGWDQIVPPRQNPLHFRPGVCPEAWTYYSMAAPNSQTISTTAFCCNSGFTFLTSGYNYLSTLGPYQCTHTATAGDKLLAVAKVSPTTTGPKDRPMVMVHEAWALTWEAADRVTLTPKLPELTSWMEVPTWTPGEVISKGVYDHDYTKSDTKSVVEYYGPEFFWFLVVGVPLISLLLTSCCVGCCVTKCKRNRRKKRAAAEESVIQPASSVLESHNVLPSHKE